MSLTDVSGKELNIATLPFKYTIVFIYDPDCSHCKEETPKLFALNDYFKSKNIGVVASSIVRDKQAWKNFIKEFKMKKKNSLPVWMKPTQKLVKKIDSEIKKMELPSELGDLSSIMKSGVNDSTQNDF